ncbi:MAG: BrnA antitoxin family protein [Pseudomonadota bacterium]
MTDRTDKPRMSKTQRMHARYAIDARRMIEYDLHSVAMKLRTVPEEWDEIWKDDDRRDAKRTRVTMRMDADVVKFFKAMGEGYQTRINRVLRTFMHYRLAGIIEGPDTTDYVLHPERMTPGWERPGWGTTQAEMAAIEERTAGYERELGET